MQAYSRTLCGISTAGRMCVEKCYRPRQIAGRTLFVISVVSPDRSVFPKAFRGSRGHCKDMQGNEKKQIGKRKEATGNLWKRMSGHDKNSMRTVCKIQGTCEKPKGNQFMCGISCTGRM